MRKENSSDRPLVTLSIVSHGDAQRINPLLDSLYQHEGARPFQVIITDNLGDDIPELSESKAHSLIMIRNKKPLGFASNHNQAFHQAAGKYFCILNPDVLFEDEIFPSLIRWLENGQADIVAPLIVDANAVPQDSFRSLPTPFEIIQRRLPGYRFAPLLGDDSGLVKPDWIAGIFMLMKSETFREVKGFDERFRLYFEDVDFCTRAQMAGFKLIVDTNIRIQHNAQRTSRKKLIYFFWHMQSAMRFFTSPVYRRAAHKPR